MAVVWFSEIGAGDIALAGGKGANLGEMARAGFPVPPGFCITAAAYRRFEESTGLDPAGLETAGLDPAGLEALAANIRALLEQAPVPAEIAAEVAAAYRELSDWVAAADGTASGGAVPVAVRSSATAEDLPEASFAGQQETYLNVQGEPQLLHHVRRCWASLWTARAISYRERSGFDHRQVSLAVVVQAMITPEVSGVLFTANPVSGDRSEMLINAAYGLGEAIVSGRVTPDTYRVAKSAKVQVIEQVLGTKEIAVRPTESGGTGEEPVPVSEQRRFCLSPRDLDSLAALGMQVEGHYQAPQDIEWGIAGGRLYLLQTRPITSLRAAPPVPRRLGRLEHTIRDDILEHYPDPPYPLDYEAVTAGYEQLQQALREAGMRVPHAREVIRMDDLGIPTVAPAAPRPTWRLLGAPGLVRRSLARDPGAWGGSQGPAIARQMNALQRADPGALGHSDLASHIEGAVNLAAEIGRIRFSQYIGPMMIRGSFLRLVIRLAGGPKASETELLGGLSFKSMEIDLALHRLAGAALTEPGMAEAVVSLPPADVAPALEAAGGGAAFLKTAAAFLREHGARTMKVYLPFSNRSWAEDPAALWATLAAIIRAGDPGAAEARMRAGTDRYAALRDRVAGRLPGPLRRWFLHLLEDYRTGHVAREATLYAIEEAYLAARAGVREAAARLAGAGVLPGPEDVLFLTLSELMAALRGLVAGPAGAAGAERHADLRRKVITRRQVRPSAAAAWHGEAGRTVAGAGAIKGLAGSPGIASGPARVIAGPAEFGRLQRGDILVCTFTDPAWTPLFGLAAGVVSDTGGPLSHAAIVAREYGIPAVLGTQVATRVLRDGERITVNGHRGTVARGH